MEPITITIIIVIEGISLAASVIGNIVQGRRIKKLQTKLQKMEVMIRNLKTALDQERKKRAELKKQMWAWFWFFSKKQRKLHNKMKILNEKISDVQVQLRKTEKERDLLKKEYEKVAT